MNWVRPFVLGVAGGTGSGKTTVAERLADAVGSDQLVLLKQDSYYRDRGDLTLAERTAINYDHPDAFDWPLLLDHVEALIDGRPVRVPVYDFELFTRSRQSIDVGPAPILVIEGILALYEAELRGRMDLKVFVDTDADIRFIRRLERDMAERGRTTTSVIQQYLDTVRPSHESFVEPTKRFADVIIPHGGRNDPALDMLVARVLKG